MQLAPGASGGGLVPHGQVLVKLKSFWLTPSRSILLKKRSMPLLLVNVFVFPALLVPSSVVGNVWVRGDSVIGVLPEPVSTLPYSEPLLVVMRICASAVSQPVG